MSKAALLIGIMIAGLSAMAYASAKDNVRVKDLGKMKGWRDNALTGYGIVTGLAGTGDSPTNRATRQALANLYSQFNLSVPPEQVQSRNVAVVTVSASLPPFAREGDVLDVNVSSVGDARSLLGGSLLLTALKGPNGRIYALSQGSLSVGGYRYDANGNVLQKNHPTVGAIPGGAVVEVGVTAQVVSASRNLTFVLSEPDYTTANRIANAINEQLGHEVAEASDAAGIDIHVPDGDSRGRLTSFIARIENVTVEPDRRAKVVIDERTGTVVAGGDVQISKVAISHGDLKIAVSSQNTASQPLVIASANPGVRTALVTNTDMRVDEQRDGGFMPPTHSTVSDLVQALVKMKTSTRDVISILRAVKSAGALHAELIIQ